MSAVAGGELEAVLDRLVREELPRLVVEEELLGPALEPADAGTLAARHAEIRSLAERLGALAGHLAGGRSARRPPPGLAPQLERLRGLLLDEARDREALARVLGAQAGAAAALEDADRRARRSIELVAQPPVAATEAVALRPNPRAHRPLRLRAADLVEASAPCGGGPAETPQEPEPSSAS